MKLPSSAGGLPYLPDGYCSDNPPPQPWPLWLRVVLFVFCYALLQALYARCIGTPIEHFFLATLGSQPAAALINLFQPPLGAQAIGSRVTAPGGGINIGNGCEGIDIYCLLVAAFAVVSLPWRSRLAGFGLGVALAFVLNQTRILALFFAYRNDRSWFELLHTTVAPVFLIVIIALYFHAWLRNSRSSTQAPL